MKRSEINTILRQADDFLRELQFYLPPFAYWTPDHWRSRGTECREIVERQLGWDITDFGSGDFGNVGLFLFTLRNGALGDLQSGNGKIYAEKIMVVQVGQITPMHFHWSKTEDIINRGGGELAVKLHSATEDERLDTDSPVCVSLDGVRKEVPAGHVVRLGPGESITLETGMYHEFWGESSTVLVGEVSAVNDDKVDNRFLQSAGRFPEIIEDEPPAFLLVGDYPNYYAHA